MGEAVRALFILTAKSISIEDKTLTLLSAPLADGRSSEELPFLPEWVALWCPRLALALVSGSESKREHISTRCIPLLIDIVGGVSCRHDAAYAFSYLLEEVRSQLDFPRAIGEQLESYAGDTDTLSDRVLWATFQVSGDDGNNLDAVRVSCC
jgi:hypothetical protein